MQIIQGWNMPICALLYLAMMSMGSHGDSILYAYQHYRPLEPNVKLPVPFLTGTAQMLVKRSGDHLIIAGAVDQELLNRQTSIVVNELKLYSDALLEKFNDDRSFFASNSIQAHFKICIQWVAWQTMKITPLFLMPDVLSAISPHSLPS